MQWQIGQTLTKQVIVRLSQITSHPILSGAMPWRPEWMKSSEYRLFAYVRKGEFHHLSSLCIYNDAWGSVCNANMDGRDIVCVMPTGKNDFTIYSVVHDSAYYRRRKVADISTPRDHVSRMHACHLAINISHGKSDNTRLSNSTILKWI